MLSLVLSASLHGPASCTSTDLRALTTVAVAADTSRTIPLRGNLVRLTVTDSIVNVAIVTPTTAQVPVAVSLDSLSDGAASITAITEVPGLVVGDRFAGSTITAIDTKGMTLADGRHVLPDTMIDYPAGDDIAAMGLPLSLGSCAADGRFVAHIIASS